MASRNAHSYLLRLWRDHADTPMRATLVPVGHPDAHEHFDDLDALLAFLRQQTEEDSHANNNWNTKHCTSSKRS